MKTIRSSLLSFTLLGLVATACGGNATPATAPTVATDAPAAAPVEAPAVDENSWEAFFPKFQEAVLGGEIDVSFLAVFGELDKDDYLDQFDMYFNEEMKKTIANSTAASWGEARDEPGVREIVWSDSTVNEDGEEFGTALMLYFKQFDGKWKLFRWMSAG